MTTQWGEIQPRSSPPSAVIVADLDNNAHCPQFAHRPGFVVGPLLPCLGHDADPGMAYVIGGLPRNAYGKNPQCNGGGGAFSVIDFQACSFGELHRSWRD